MKPEYKELISKAKKDERINLSFRNYLKRRSPKDLDVVFQKAHEQAFEKINCLGCANCCKTISPTFYQKDIDRLAKKLRIRPADFIEKYLQIDEENDYVLKSTPCPFLADNNECTVYDSRPTACKEYPHTDKKGMAGRMFLTLNNAEVCPAVAVMMDTVKDNYKF